MTKNILLFGAIICILLMGFIGKCTTVNVCTILNLPFAPTSTGLKEILSGSSGVNFLGKLKSIYAVDMVFIIFYTSILWLWTHGEMNRSRQLWINSTLRLNLLLITFAGFSDLLENMIMFYNFEIFNTSASYISCRTFAQIKWVLISWIISSLLVSKLVRLLDSTGHTSANSARFN